MAMFSKANRRLLGRTMYRRRSLLFLLGLLSFVFWYNLPLIQEKAKNRADRRTPIYDVDEVPHFLHHSSFRLDPDLEYEERVLHALRNIEHAVLHENGGDYSARDKIWQVMLGKNKARSEDSMAFEEENEGWEYELVTTDAANAFVDNVFLTVPDLKHIYTSYPLDVLRADLLRYLLLWYHGGYYADTDVFPRRSIKSCPSLAPLFPPPSAQTHPNISLAIGIELDEPKASANMMRQWRWTRRYGFIQYTLYAPRRFSPILRETIVRVLSHTRQYVQQSYRPWGPRYSEHAIMEISGPGLFTDAVLDTLSATLPAGNRLVEQSVGADLGVGDLVMRRTGVTQRRVTWAPFFGIKEPLCVDASEAPGRGHGLGDGDRDGNAMGGLCVLPVNAWGNGQRHSGSENFGSQHACVNHRFKGSWKPWKKTWKEYFFG